MMRFSGLLLAGALAAMAADPAIEKALSDAILAPKQTTIETQIHLASRVKPMPLLADQAAWEKYARELRPQILDNVVFRGDAAKWRDLPTKVEWQDTIEANGYRVKKFRYEVVPGMWLPGLLYEPAQLTGRVPAIVNLNGHEGDGKANSYIQERCINLAKKGMLAYNYEWFGMGELKTQGNTHYRLNQIDFTGTSGLAVFFLAQKRLVDIALQHPNADPARIGATGLSGGGWQTIILSSLDPRIKLAMPVAGYSSFVTRTQFERDLGDSEQTPVDLGMYADYTHLTAMVAPNPLMVANNARDNCCFRADYAQAPLMVAARPIFGLFGDTGRLRAHTNFDDGHNYGLENRETLYRFVAEFFGVGSPEEIPSSSEVRTVDQLRVPLPPENETLHSLATKLAASLPRRGGDREKLREVVRWPKYRATAHRMSSENGVNKWEVAAGDWTVPAVEFVGTGPTVLVVGDGGRAKLGAEVDELRAQNRRVVAMDPWYFGESKIEIRDNLYGLLVSALGERPLGIQAAQIAAVARWLKQRDGSVSIVAYGPRTGLMARVAAAADPEVGDVRVVREWGSLKEVLEKDVEPKDMPEVFCFGLLEWFDIEQLKRLATVK
jgi:dienelactone hydrolase